MLKVQHFGLPSEEHSISSKKPFEANDKLIGKIKLIGRLTGSRKKSSSTNNQVIKRGLMAGPISRKKILFKQLFDDKKSSNGH